MNAPRRIDAVLFDFDGTLTTPGHLDFRAIRRAIGCPEGVSILSYIETLAPPEQDAANATLDDFEMRAAAEVAGASGVTECVRFFTGREIPVGVLTRNTLRAVRRSLENIPEVSISDFACVITRDDEIPVKPEPDGVIEAAHRVGVKPRSVAMVGDYLYDIDAGRNAGAVTVFVDNLRSRHFPAPQADFVVSDIRTLIPLLSPYLAR